MLQRQVATQAAARAVRPGPGQACNRPRSHAHAQRVPRSIWFFFFGGGGREWHEGKDCAVGAVIGAASCGHHANPYVTALQSRTPRLTVRRKPITASAAPHLPGAIALQSHAVQYSMNCTVQCSLALSPPPLGMPTPTRPRGVGPRSCAAADHQAAPAFGLVGDGARRPQHREREGALEVR